MTNEETENQGEEEMHQEGMHSSRSDNAMQKSKDTEKIRRGGTQANSRPHGLLEPELFWRER